VMDLADINRFIAVVDQQRRASPAHRYYICNHSSNAIVTTGCLLIATVDCGPLLQCRFVVVTEHTSLQKNAVLL
jgi:hypothetical protein